MPEMEFNWSEMEYKWPETASAQTRERGDQQCDIEFFVIFQPRRNYDLGYWE